MMLYVTKSQIQIHKHHVLYGTGLCCTTPGEHFLGGASRHDIHTGTTQLGVVIYLRLMMRGKCDYFTELHCIGCTLISSCIQNVLIPRFMLNDKISFLGPDKLAFSYVPTQGAKTFEKFSNYLYSRPYVSVVA